MKNKSFFSAFIILGMIVLATGMSFAEKNQTETEKYLMDNLGKYSPGRYYDRYDDRYYDRYDRYYDRYYNDRYYDRNYRYDDRNYTRYYNNGRYYYSTDYTYRDSDGYKHYVNLKYYYDSHDDRVYSVYDYYYDKNDKKVVYENKKEFTDYDRHYDYDENYNRRRDIFSESSYYRDYHDDEKYYVYRDTYFKDSKKHYVFIEYYYDKNGKKVYTINDYYFEDGKKYKTVDVDEKILTDKDLKYYLEYYLDSNEYNDRYYWDDRYYDNDRYYNDRYYRDDRYRYDRYYQWDKRDSYYRQYKYTNFDDYIDKINNLRYVGYGGYYYYYDRYNDRYYTDDDRYYYKNDYRGSYSIADYFPSDFAPNEKTWPKKSELSERKKDIAKKMAYQIERERSYMGKDYFSMQTVNSLMFKYFKSEFDSSYNDSKRLEKFLYYFGFVNAIVDRHMDENDIRGFLYNYGEPMFLILKYYETGYYTDEDVNKMRRGEYNFEKENNTGGIEDKNSGNFLSERENHYFSNKKEIMRRERN